MKTWQRILIWGLLVLIAAVIVPGVDPFGPILLAIVLIAAFELTRARLFRTR
jgi:Sec-independent protein secretion pathway component TatC